MQFLFLCTTGLVLVLSVLAQRRPPNYSLDEMPDIQTSFSCRDKVVGGYYADPETDCQMFHVCVRIPGVGIQDFRFLCPNDTSFDQENQICDDWYNIDCEVATLYYSDNFDLYRIGNGADFGPSKATPIPLGPSSIAPRPQYTKPRRPINPVNNAVSDQDDNYLQRGDAGDRKVASDLLRGSSSGNFFNNRNRGKEDDDDIQDHQPEQELIKNKKKTKVRKLLTGKRPLNSVTPTPAANTYATQAPVAYNNQNKYSTLQRNRPTETQNYPTSSTAQQAPNRSFNNNYSGTFNRQNTQQSSTTGFNNEYNKYKTSFNPYTTRATTPSTDYYAETTTYNYNNNYNNNNNKKASVNYNQAQTTVAPQYNYYSQQTTTPAPTNYNAYQQSRVTTTAPNYSYTSQSTSAYYDATTSRPNYYQQPSTTTVNYDNYYKTSTDYYSSSTDAAPFQTAHNAYQQTKNEYNYNVNAASAASASASENQPNYDPYTSYQNANADKYDEPSQGESLKTAPSSNIRPSDFNSFKSFQQKPSGFNTSLTSSYNFNSVQPTTTTTQKPTSKYYSTHKQYQQGSSYQTTNYKPSKANTYYEQSTAAGQTKPRPFSKSPSTTPATKSLKTKDASYDYAYYDDGPASEYDAVEPIGQEFSRTTPAKNKRASSK